MACLYRLHGVARGDCVTVPTMSYGNYLARLVRGSGVGPDKMILLSLLSDMSKENNEGKPEFILYMHIKKGRICI